MTIVSVSALTDEALVLKALKGISKTLSGSTAAATTIARKRAVFYNLLDYAVSPGKLLTANPLVGVKWKTPKVSEEVSPRRVINPQQSRGPAGDRLEDRASSHRFLRSHVLLCPATGRGRRPDPR